MAAERTKVEDSFWCSEFGFVCNRDWIWDGLPKGVKQNIARFDQTLERSGRLPDLNGKPVASWVLARCAHLCGKRFPYTFGQVLGSDGGDYSIGFFALSNALKPIGGLYLLGDEKRVFLGAESAFASGVEGMIDEFTTILLAGPLQLKKANLTVVYTSVEDPGCAWRIPYVFGWNGKRFLGHRDPEHAIDPSEYE